MDKAVGAREDEHAEALGRGGTRNRDDTGQRRSALFAERDPPLGG